MRGRRAGAVSWALAVLSAMALAIAGILAYADHTVFASDPFADRAAATLQTAPVRDAAARRLTDVVVGARPDLVGLRPIVELAARAVVGTPQFRSLVRRAALDAHRSAFDAHSRGLTLQIRDAGLLVADVVQRLAPRAADRMPTRVITRVARIHGGVHGFMLRIAEHADRARPAKWIALAAALVLALIALVVTDSRRASVLRLGVAYAVVGVAVAVAAALAPALLADSVGPADRAAVRAALGVWLDPVTAWALAAAFAGVVVALAAAAVVRPIPVMALLRRAWSAGRDPAAQPARARAARAGGDRSRRRDGAVAARCPRGADRGGRGAARPRRDDRGAGAGSRAARARATAARPQPPPRAARGRGGGPGHSAPSRWPRCSRAARARRSRGSGAATATPRCAIVASTRSRSSAPTTPWRPPTSRGGSSQRRTSGSPSSSPTASARS